jgi:HK97 family phage prohead protease
MTNKIERRSFTFEQRAGAEGEAPKIVGHAALFNVEADLGSFREMIDPGAFTSAIKTDDVRALFNHDPNYVLGRNTSGTLRLSEDEKGLAIEIDPPDTGYARDLMVSMKRGDISQMSFGFIAREQRVERRGDALYRIVTRASLVDVSPVTYPAYRQTDVAVRSADEVFAEITADEEARKAAEQVHSEPIPAPVTTEPEAVDLEPIYDVHRRRLQLLG